MPTLVNEIRPSLFLTACSSASMHYCEHKQKVKWRSLFHVFRATEVFYSCLSILFMKEKLVVSLNKWTLHTDLYSLTSKLKTSVARCMGCKSHNIYYLYGITCTVYLLYVLFCNIWFQKLLPQSALCQ